LIIFIVVGEIVPGNMSYSKLGRKLSRGNLSGGSVWEKCLGGKLLVRKYQVTTVRP